MQTAFIRFVSFRSHMRDAGHVLGPGGVVLTPQEARQGVISGRVLLVLIVSLMLAVLAGAIMAAVHFIPV